MGNSIAIIPARGGSKRIPRKNIKNFLGKPIIAYSIERAIQSGLFEEVMVSTDDEEIAELSIQYGAKVPFKRSPKNADDFATTLDVLKEVLETYSAQKKEFDYCCCIYPTAVLSTEQQLKEGFNALVSKKLDAIYPAVAFSYPIWRGLEISDDDRAKMVWPEHINTRSQDLKKVYHDAGQWYWLKTSSLLQGRTIQDGNTSILITDESRVQDIDTAMDWQLAEMKYRLLHA